MVSVTFLVTSTKRDGLNEKPPHKLRDTSHLALLEQICPGGGLPEHTVPPYLLFILCSVLQ